MRLGIDLDGVVANFTKGWMDFYNREKGTTLTVADSRGWHDMLTLTHFKDMGQFWQWAERLDGHSVFWHLEPFPGAVAALRQLTDEGHTIVIITSRPAMARDDTHEWIESHGIPAAEIHMLDQKWLVNCDIYLDDGPHLLPDLVRNQPEALVVRYVRPWNTPVEGAVDIDDFVEFRDLVERRSAGSLM